MTTSTDDNELRQRLEDLWDGSMNTSKIKLPAPLRGRHQTIELERKSGEIVATTEIAKDLHDRERRLLLRANRHLRFIYLRIHDDTLKAYLHLTRNIGLDEELELLHYLTRTADQLEYEFLEGEDRY